MSPRGLPYSRFIELLIMLECYIPAYPQTFGSEFLIYRWGGGYNAQPKGPSAPFIHRQKTDMATVLEISKTLNLLDIKGDVFWQHADNCAVEPDQKNEKPVLPSTPPKSSS
jgi:hypothetical protein